MYTAIIVLYYVLPIYSMISFFFSILWYPTIADEVIFSTLVEKRECYNFCVVYKDEGLTRYKCTPNTNKIDTWLWPQMYRVDMLEVERKTCIFEECISKKFQSWIITWLGVSRSYYTPPNQFGKSLFCK